MADITWADVENHAAELSTVLVPAQTNILAHVNEALVVADLDGGAGAKTKLTRIYLAAHIATADKLAASGASGPVTAEGVDGLSRSYGVTAASSGDITFFQSTGYGRQYLAMVRTSAARVPLLL